jgi:hypothetical protein
MKIELIMKTETEKIRFIFDYLVFQQTQESKMEEFRCGPRLSLGFSTPNTKSAFLSLKGHITVVVGAREGLRRDDIQHVMIPPEPAKRKQKFCVIVCDFLTFFNTPKDSMLDRLWLSRNLVKT